MGTVFSFDVRDGDFEHAVAEAVDWLHHVDETFSTYRPESVVSRLDRGELTLADCPPEVAEVLRLCDDVSRASHGYFTSHPDGRLDPSAVVKGWAIERASRILTRAGAVNHCVNGGGDVQLTGSAAPGSPWRVGIAHPLRPGELAAVVTGRDLAVATSGTAERGAHILDPHTHRPATALASITLVGKSLTLTDAYATAAFAMGHAARDWVEELEGFGAFAVTAFGATWHTGDFPELAILAD
ncbi:FAD:protein FMN transferase [Planotetraspora mira]|uniref:FAD:protein FMN transferase n=2 Tax=Planotetraspora mira TaxID=58121 RepID=A0A8J3X9S0_9ACTN|nr:FAD:protein FMN transferase [Planotetraspora mira]